MKHFLLFAFTLISWSATFAQIPKDLGHLEGRWTSGNIISEWQFTSDFALNNRTWKLVAGDTVDISWSYIRTDKNGITTLTYITPYGENHQFRLVPSEPYTHTWRNEQANALPTCVRIEHNGVNTYTWSGLGETMVFKHEKEGHFRLKLGISLGMNRGLTEEPAHSRMIDRTNLQGVESALSLNLRHTKSIFGANLEIGYYKTNNTSNRYLLGESSTIHFQGSEHLSSMYIALIPECHLGKRGQWVISTGAVKPIFPEKRLDGTFEINGHSSLKDRAQLYNTAYLKRQPSLLAGISYEPGFKLGSTQPVFYCRGVSRSSISAGVKLLF
jgi:hypothetical protein